MTVLFYDNVATGHHLGYMAGIVAAAEKRDLSFVVASVERPATLTAEDRWIGVDSAPLRSVFANRSQLGGAARRAAAMGASVLIDLYLDKQIWAVGSAGSLPTSVHVLHHAEQYSRAGRQGLAGLRTAYLRQRLKRLAQSGPVIVVHNQPTAEILGGIVPDEHLVLAGYPVIPLPSDRRTQANSRPTLLFVGAGREEKGLDLLFGALASRPDLATLRVVGRQPPGLRPALMAQYPEVAVTWLDDFVDDETLHNEYRTVDLAVLPYRTSFGLHGGPSSVLLETLSAGLPIVTTSALADQLPAGYGGAEIAAADSVRSLTESIGSALKRLAPMAIEAATDGPKFIAENHTFDSYLDALMRAVDRARA